MYSDDIASEIQDLFAEFAPAEEGALVKNLFHEFNDLQSRNGDQLSERQLSGFTIFTPEPLRPRSDKARPEGQQRLEQMRTNYHALADRQTAEALESGWRPQRWSARVARIAEGMGIVIPRKTPVRSAEANARKAEKERNRAIADKLVTCGAPGGVS